MGKIFITGDKHGDYANLSDKLNRYSTSKEDVVIILGDHGALYYEDNGAARKKKWLNSLPATFICIRGNHDHRPDCAAYNHKLIDVNEPTHSGQFYIDEKCPNVLFTKEYGWYRFGNKRVFVIGGAFSVDKYRRIEMQKLGIANYLWFSDEQLYPYERKMANQELDSHAAGEFYMFSHTCPFKYIPKDTFISGIDQKTIDQTMEKWLDKIEYSINYTKWYVGHWHIDRKHERIQFLYEDIILFDELEESK